MDVIADTVFWAGLIRYSIEFFIFQSRSRTFVFALLSALITLVIFLSPYVYERTAPWYHKTSRWVSNAERLVKLHRRVLAHSLQSLRRRGHWRIEHHMMTTSTHPYPQFFNLPRELRNLVYQYALVTTNIHASLYPAGSPTLPQVAVALLHASRRLRAEVAPVLYRLAHFTTTARHPFTKFVNDKWVGEITSLTLRADLGFFLRYDSVEHALATEISRLRNLVHLAIRFKTFQGEYGPLDVAASIVACVGKMENLRLLELEGVRRAPETQVFADSIRGQLGDTILSWRGSDPNDQTVVIRGMAGPLRVLPRDRGGRRGMNLWRLLA